MVIRIDALDLFLVRFKKSALEALFMRLERSRPFIHVEKYLVGQAARNSPFAEFSLGVEHVTDPFLSALRGERAILW